MILFINSSQTDLIQLKLIKKNKVVSQLTTRKEYQQSELLLPMINRLLKKTKVSPKSLSVIAVVSGPGSFSALRLGIATANTIAWILNIPIIDLSADQIIEESSLIKIISQNFKTVITFKPIIPKYGKEPNITKSKEIKGK